MKLHLLTPLFAESFDIESKELSCIFEILCHVHRTAPLDMFQDDTAG
jgi:hypothetical protein